jgi:hypothetical protein
MTRPDGRNRIGRSGIALAWLGALIGIGTLTALYLIISNLHRG